jgi:hypothetical protein
MEAPAPVPAPAKRSFSSDGDVYPDPPLEPEPPAAWSRDQFAQQVNDPAVRVRSLRHSSDTVAAISVLILAFAVAASTVIWLAAPKQTPSKSAPRPSGYVGDISTHVATSAPTESAAKGWTVTTLAPPMGIGIAEWEQ